MSLETNIARLRPEQIISILKRKPVIYIPVGPLEWHGPHLPLGVDPINAERVALAVCEKTGGLVWPTLFWGTERERPPQVLENLGFRPDEYIVGMDFPNNRLPSGYCHEEIFAILIRETLRLVGRMGAKLAVIVNGHGAVNHNQVLQRLAIEFNHTTNLRVHIRIAFPEAGIKAGSIAHAGSDETSLMMYYDPELVDLSRLPPRDIPLRYQDFAIVDGPGFDGKGRPDKVVEDDPRTKGRIQKGEELFRIVLEEMTREAETLLAEISAGQ
jgi:creatinine amidohydrolase